MARKRRSRRRWVCVLTCVAMVAAGAAAGLLRSHAQSSIPLPAIDLPKPAHPTSAAQQDKQQPAVSVADMPEKKEIANECADLLKMATALKTEVDKTTKDTLSVTVVRKAGEIEQWAHKVRTGTGKS